MEPSPCYLNYRLRLRLPRLEHRAGVGVILIRHFLHGLAASLDENRSYRDSRLSGKLLQFFQAVSPRQRRGGRCVCFDARCRGLIQIHVLDVLGKDVGCGRSVEDCGYQATLICHLEDGIVLISYVLVSYAAFLLAFDGGRTVCELCATAALFGEANPTCRQAVAFEVLALDDGFRAAMRALALACSIGVLRFAGRAAPHAGAEALPARDVGERTFARNPQVCAVNLLLNLVVWREAEC